MGTNFYMWTKDKRLIEEFAPFSYKLTDKPDFGYLFHMAKTSVGWLPLFVAHKDGIHSISEYKYAYEYGGFKIYDEYYTEYNWEAFKDRVLKFNGGINGIQKKEKIIQSTAWYDNNVPKYMPISHCSEPDCTYNFGIYSDKYFKDPEGYEFTYLDFC